MIAVEMQKTKMTYPIEEGRFVLTLAGSPLRLIEQVIEHRNSADFSIKSTTLLARTPCLSNAKKKKRNTKNYREVFNGESFGRGSAKRGRGILRHGHRGGT